MQSLNVSAYEWIGAPPVILEWTKYGAKVHFTADPEPQFLPNRVKGACEYNSINGKVKKLLKQGAICQCYNWRPVCIMSIQCVPKKGSKLWMVLDCRHVNQYISQPKFSHKGID